MKLDWIRSNALSVLSLVVGLVGLATGYLFYRASLQYPALSFVDQGQHVVVINFGALSSSPVSLQRKDGSQVTQNVRSARLYVWNSGTTPIRKSAVLVPLVIRSSNVEILDVKSANATRLDATRTKVDLVGSESISLSFDILEPGDGTAINVLYAAPGPAAFDLYGAVEGVRTFAPADSLPTGDAGLKVAWAFAKGLGILVLLLGGVAGGSALLSWASKKIPDSRAKKLAGRILLPLVGTIFAVTVVIALFQEAHKEAVGTPGAFVPAALRK